MNLPEIDAKLPSEPLLSAYQDPLLMILKRVR